MILQDARLIKRWRFAAYLLPCLAVVSAVLLSRIMGVSWMLEDCATSILVAGPPLLLGWFLTRLGKVPAFAGVLTIFSLTVALMLVGAALALLGTRSPAPIADPWLAAADRALPVSAMEIVRFIDAWPSWAISALHKVYTQTGLYLFLTLIVLHLMERGALALRMFLIWGISFILISLIAFSAPALGCFSQLSAAEVEHLPGGAGRYAIRAFTNFRNAADPVLSFDRVSGVITFPSFHTVCALLIAQAWDGSRIGGLAKVLTGAIILSCVPMGGHYLVDLIAGAAVWWVVTLAVDRLGKPRPAPAPGAAIAVPAA